MSSFSTNRAHKRQMTDSDSTSQAEPRGDLSACRALSPGHFRSGPSAAPGRLASLRTRDMTLVGPPKKPRRTFEPNVHVVRKSKDELKEHTTTSPQQRRPEREEKRKERRVVKREKPRTIQSHSIFEQAPAAACTRRTGRGSGPCETTLSTQLKREPQDDGQAALDKLYRDDFIDDPSLRNCSKLTPIQLPLRHTPSQSTTAHPTRGGDAAVCEAKQPSLVELFRDLQVSDANELFFMQLPDCMPLKTVTPKAPDTAGRGPSKPARRESLHQGKAGENVQTQEPVLSGFSEGLLGKLQLRKSGKVVLKLGDISMDVTEGAAFSFLQQLVSVRLSEGRSGDMMVLGNVSHKLVLSPVFQTLIDQSETKKP
ncbi:unnamed protein product [Knipowitschia caucasica]